MCSDILHVPVPTGVLPSIGLPVCGHRNQWINLPIAELSLIARKATLLKVDYLEFFKGSPVEFQPVR